LLLGIAIPWAVAIASSTSLGVAIVSVLLAVGAVLLSSRMLSKGRISLVVVAVAALAAVHLLFAEAILLGLLLFVACRWLRTRRELVELRGSYVAAILISSSYLAQSFFGFPIENLWIFFAGAFGLALEGAIAPRDRRAPGERDLVRATDHS
jgi:hypothetical protein